MAGASCDIHVRPSGRRGQSVMRREQKSGRSLLEKPRSGISSELLGRSSPLCSAQSPLGKCPSRLRSWAAEVGPEPGDTVGAPGSSRARSPPQEGFLSQSSVLTLITLNIKISRLLVTCTRRRFGHSIKIWVCSCITTVPVCPRERLWPT